VTFFFIIVLHITLSGDYVYFYVDPADKRCRWAGYLPGKLHYGTSSS